MPPQKETGVCKCNWLEVAADDPKCPVEFDKELNEYHLVRGPKDYLMIYFCPFCGGSGPKSKRDRLFLKLTDKERARLLLLTRNMRTVRDVTGTFGKPDKRLPVGETSVQPEGGGRPEMTCSYPVMIYSKISELADVHVTIYPVDKVGFAFLSKPKKKSK